MNIYIYIYTHVWYYYYDNFRLFGHCIQSLGPLGSSRRGAELTCKGEGDRSIPLQPGSQEAGQAAWQRYSQTGWNVSTAGRAEGEPLIQGNPLHWETIEEENHRCFSIGVSKAPQYQSHLMDTTLTSHELYVP